MPLRPQWVNHLFIGHPNKRLKFGRIETAGKDGKMRASELADRGIWWQVAGFTLVGCVSLAILELFAGSDAVPTSGLKPQ